MSSTIIYKLRSATKFDVVRFDGRTIKARDAKVLIAEHMGCQEPQIDIYRNGSLLVGDEDLVASSNVEVERKNVVLKAKPMSQIQKDAMAKEEAKNIFGAGAAAAGGSAAALAPKVIGSSEMSEDERINLMQQSVGHETGGAAFRGRGGGPGGRGGMGAGGMPNRPPPPSYVCHACGKGGHYIEHCPERNRADGKRYAQPIGISEANLVRCEAGDPAAKFVTKDGHWVKRRVDGAVFVSAAPADESTAPTEYKCPRCSNLLTTALKLPCCDKHLCSSCLDAVVEKAATTDDPPQCPVCEEVLIADECEVDADFRKKVEAWRSTARAKRDRDE